MNNLSDSKGLEEFLRWANANTYANAAAPKVAPSRLCSHDYEVRQGSYVFHDTYFGGRKFIGEEIAYFENQPVWGMNYHGRSLREGFDEAALDKCLRAALMAPAPEMLPLRGPASLEMGELRYTFVVDGTLAGFSGIEQITQSGTPIYRCWVHGGTIER